VARGTTSCYQYLFRYLLYDMGEFLAYTADSGDSRHSCDSGLRAAAHAADGPATNPLPHYNGSLSGARNKTGDGPPYFKAIGPQISPEDLGSGGYAKFTTTVQTNAFAANWSTDGMSESAGFLRVIPGEKVDYTTPLASPAHDGDPIIWMQFNSAGTGYCTNNKFMKDGSYVFGDGGKCGTVPDRSSHQEGAMPRLRWTVTMNGSGTYKGTLALLVNGSAVDKQHFSGTLPGSASTEFVPVIRLRVGSDTGDKMPHPDKQWKFTAASSKITVYSTNPNPHPDVVPYLRPFIGTGFGGMAQQVMFQRHDIPGQAAPACSLVNPAHDGWAARYRAGISPPPCTARSAPVR